MDIEDLRRIAAGDTPPATLRPELRALVADARGDWDVAHALVQDEDGPDAAWVHAYLHRKEGDLANADFWYARAGQERPRGSFGPEWEALARALLAGA